MRTEIKVPGSCGELLQGFYRGEPLLVTCPIKKFSRITVSDEFEGIEGLGEKSLKMLRKILKLYNVPEFKFGIRLHSELPPGKGMASSSADLAAVAFAVARFMQKKISPEEVAKLAAEIEPTDGIFYPGIVAMNPLTGKFIRQIFLPEKFQIAVFDYGGEIDTLKFNRRSGFQIFELGDTLNFDLMKKSAAENQKILFKPHLKEITKFAEKTGAVAANVAHSGTVLGIFFHEDDFKAKERISKISAKFPVIKFLTQTQICDGGIEIC